MARWGHWAKRVPLKTSVLMLHIENRLGPRLLPPIGEVSFIRGIEIIEPSVRAPHKEGLRFLLGMEVL
jgi:hypothetical protein